jgi:hypothetical protein
MPNSKKIAVASEGILLFDSLIGMGLAAHVLRLAAWTTAPPSQPSTINRKTTIDPPVPRAGQETQMPREKPSRSVTLDEIQHHHPTQNEPNLFDMPAVIESQTTAMTVEEVARLFKKSAETSGSRSCYSNSRGL